jgi:mannose-6-phosphate isomerase-like protein (cupin superfamily)
MHAFEVSDLQQQRRHGQELYLEFLRQPALSMGLYELAAGSKDPQGPHTEDEVYYVISGRGQIRVGDEDQPVRAGSIVYVAANVEHYFHTITEVLSILVVFAPAEYTAESTVANERN